MRYILLFFLFLPLSVYCQSKHSWEEYFNDINGIEDYDENALTVAYEHLCELEESPININTATIDDLSEIPGLSIEQISDIIEFRDRYGELKTMEELSMIGSISAQLRIFLSNFFVAKPIEQTPWYKKENLSRIMKNGHGTVLSDIQIPMYERKGDKDGYYGGKYKYGIKLTGSFSNHIKYGFIAAQDAGEPFFSHGNKYGVDHYSFYVSVSEWGRLSKLVVGRYRVRFGMGLVLNNNFSFGKQTMLSSVGSVTNNITGHSSRSDANYFQGAAATISLGNSAKHNRWELSTVYSYRKKDATLNADGTISTILTSGYHRTKSEMDKKNNTSALVAGSHLAWKWEGWHAGVTAMYNWFDRDLAPSYSSDGYKYRKYNARGNAFWNASIDYGYCSSRLSLSGETATGSCGALATLNALQAKPNSSLTLMAVQRFYSYKYYSLYSSAFSDGGNVQNESGIYLGARWELPIPVVLDVYSDLSYSPWLKYQVNASSYSWDNSLSATSSIRGWDIMARYRLRIKERNNTSRTSLVDRTEHRGRLSATHAGDKWTLRTQIDMAALNFDTKRPFGWMLSQSVRCQMTDKMDCSVLAAYFNTDDYDTRLYTYERSVLNTFSMPSYYGKGVRLSSVFRYDVSKSFMLMCKIGYTKYFDRSTIGTDLRQINASYQTDIMLQLRYKF